MGREARTVMNFESTDVIHNSLDQAAPEEREIDESGAAQKIDISNVLVSDQLLIDFGV
jgi:hypothetical protein